MTTQYDNVYLKETATIAGPYEKNGPLNDYFDKSYNNLYVGEKSFEKAETKLLSESIEYLLDKSKFHSDEIDLFVGGDLLNQITSSCYSVKKYNRPFLGIYGACSTISEGIIIGSIFLQDKNIKNVVVSTSSHNMASERQFRNPNEYGAPKPDTATITSTGGASCLLSNKKSLIRVESSTIGVIQDMGQSDPNNVGAAMAPAAKDTIERHLKDLNRDSSYYDLILTGDLGLYGKKILIDMLKIDSNIDISNNYNDCGVMLYDLDTQKQQKAGGSGPVCSALVTFSYVYKMLKEKKLKRVLLVATGALFSPTFIYQKQNILSIAHAVSLEVVE